MGEKPIRILMIDDDPVSGKLTRAALAASAETEFSIDSAASLEEGLGKLSTGGQDVVLLDLSLPDSEGLDTLVKISSAAPAMPIVVLTDGADRDVAVEAVKRGAQDYLIKGPLDIHVLGRALRYAIERKRGDRAIRDEALALGERVKELRCLYGIAELSTRTDLSLEALLQQIVELLPGACQLPGIACARIKLGDEEYKTKGFSPAPWKLACDIFARGERMGFVEVRYLEESPGRGDEGPFLREERDLINAVAIEIGRIVDNRGVRAQLESLASFPEHFPSPIVELDADGKTGYLNPAAKEAFPDLEEKGSRHPVLKGLQAVREALRKSPEKPLEETVVFDGKTYEERIHFIPSTGSIRIVLMDITERTRVERLKEEFLHNVSHELKTPLTAINQAVRLILDGITGECSSSQRRFLEIADRNVGHLRAMIDDLLEVTRAETGKLTVDPRRISFSKLAAEVISTEKMGKADRKVELVNLVPPDLPTVYADPVRVSQVLINLIDNALKFTQDGGRVSVSAAVSGKGSYRVQVMVADTGCGMDSESARRVFDKLYQVRGSREVEGSRKGLGLGLYICKQIVSRHGGKISMESEPGKGSVVTFSLPVFSLEKLLEPVVMHDGRPVGSLALLQVEVYPADHVLTDKAARNALLEARNVLKHGIHPYDLLLPEIAPAGSEGLLFVAAPIAAKSVSNMAARLEKMLGGAHIIRSNRLAPKATTTTVRLSRGSVEGEEPLSEAARKIEALALEAVKLRAAAAEE